MEASPGAGVGASGGNSRKARVVSVRAICELDDKDGSYLLILLWKVVSYKNNCTLAPNIVCETLAVCIEGYTRVRRGGAPLALLAGSGALRSLSASKKYETAVALIGWFVVD